VLIGRNLQGWVLTLYPSVQSRRQPSQQRGRIRTSRWATGCGAGKTDKQFLLLFSKRSACSFLKKELKNVYPFGLLPDRAQPVPD
jgi:hypothetical protein